MRKIIAAIMLTGFCLAPALAQTTPAGQAKSKAECEANFKAADKSNDGMLSKEEVEEAKMTLPSSLESEDDISMDDFIEACEAK
jgi:hypothetical protein